MEPGRRAPRPVAPARADREAARDDRLPRPRLERRRPARQPPGGGRRARRATASRCWRRRRPTTPTRSARCSTSRRSSTPACGSRPTLEPEALLDACKAVERELGREPGGVRHGPRPIDVDVLLLGDREHARERLTLPHAQVTARRFVLIPLLELDFDLRTPDGTRSPTPRRTAARRGRAPRGRPPARPRSDRSDLRTCRSTTSISARVASGSSARATTIAASSSAPISTCASGRVGCRSSSPASIAACSVLRRGPVP